MILQVHVLTSLILAAAWPLARTLANEEIRSRNFYGYNDLTIIG